jgi:hypothetical protein
VPTNVWTVNRQNYAVTLVTSIWKPVVPRENQPNEATWDRES